MLFNSVLLQIRGKIWKRVDWRLAPASFLLFSIGDFFETHPRSHGPLFLGFQYNPVEKTNVMFFFCGPDLQITGKIFLKDENQNIGNLHSARLEKPY